MDRWDQLEQLRARIPELEWQLSKMDSCFPSSVLPKGLFRQPWDRPGSAYANEIKEDLSLLASYSKQAQNKTATQFLALKINQKIHVLVSLCKQYQRDNTGEKSTSYAITNISTRQEWLQNLETQIQAMHRQKEALLEALSQKKGQNDAISGLSLRKELGELEKKVTLAEETFVKATK